MAKIFISYSHKDEEYKNRLLIHLKPLSEQYLFSVWNDREMKVGQVWKEKVVKELHEADAAVLLISADFLASEFINKIEVPELIRRRKKENIEIIPVIAKGCTWKRINWLNRLLVIPKDGKPLSVINEEERDIIWAQVAEDIADIVAESGPGNKLNTLLTRVIGKQKKDFFDRNLYININGVKRNPKQVLEKNEGKHETNDYEPLDKFVNQWLIEKNSNCLVILGEYGTSKTTYLQYLAYRSYSNRVKQEGQQVIPGEKKRLPFFLPVRDYDKDIESFVINQLKLKGIGGFKYHSPDMSIDHDELLILLDGFDEIIRKIDYSGKPESFAKIRKIIDENRNSKIILTAREEYFRSEKEMHRVFRHHEKTNVSLAYILPFNEDQVEQYLKNHIGEDRYYLDQFEIYPEIRDLAKRPALLKSIVEYLRKWKEENEHNEMGYDKPMNLAQLYRCCIDDEIDRKNKSFDLIIPSENRLNILEKLALWMFLNDMTTFDIKSLENEFNIRQTFKIERDWEYQKCLDQFLTFTLLNRVGNEQYRISHDSFKDYLTASMFVREIIEKNPENFVKARLTDNINSLICENASILENEDYESFKETLIYIIKNTRDQRDDTTNDIRSNIELQGTKAASILITIDKDALRGEDISFCHLPSVDFRGVNLTGTNLEEANLDCCTFDENLFNAIHYEKARLDNSNLYLNDPGFQDFFKLKNLKNLQKIDLSGNTLDGLAVLQEQVNLRRLVLNDNKIKDLSPLKYLKNLIKLDLRNNGIDDLSGIEYLVELRELNLSNDFYSSSEVSTFRSNKIIDLSPLKYLNKLERLVVTNNLRLEERQISELRKALPGCKIIY